MDPTQCLKELLEMKDRLNEFFDQDAIDDYMSCGYGVEDLEFLLQRIEALHEWMAKGGFLPEQWTKNREGATLKK